MIKEYRNYIQIGRIRPRNGGRGGPVLDGSEGATVIVNATGRLGRGHSDESEESDEEEGLTRHLGRGEEVEGVAGLASLAGSGKFFSRTGPTRAKQDSQL